MLRLGVVAHAKWFVDRSMSFPSDWGFLLHPVSIAMVGTAGGLVAAWVVATWRTRVRDLPGHHVLVRLQRWLPRLVAASLGAALLALAVTDSLLAPHLSLRGIAGGSAIALTEGFIGAWLVTGVRLRQAAAALGMLAVTGLVLHGLVPVLEASHMWGIALFVWLACGPDRTGSPPPSDARLRWGSLALRLGVGIALVAGAVSEKLANPALTTALLEAQPELNLPRTLGIGLDTATFIRLSGAVEMLFGLLIMAGVTPRLVVCITAVPLLLPPPLLGRTELLGHLPFYGALLALLVYGAIGRPTVDDRIGEVAPTQLPPSRI